MNCIKPLLVSFLLFSVVMGGFVVSGQTNAAVPVEVVGFNAGTEYELGIETFMFDLFQSLQKRQEDFTTSFELQKIEKAREDVNKLIYETQRELIDYGAVTAGAGILDPVTGVAMIIKKPSRIIHNLDDFLYEEPIQKGRDFIYCYFGGDLSPGITPWKLFPLGIDETESILLQRSVRDKLLARIQRKAKFEVTAPSQTWYTEALCERILASFPVNSDCFEDPSRAGCITKSELNYNPTLPASLSAIKESRGYFTIHEMSQAILNPNNTVSELFEFVSKRVESIIAQYAGLRYAEYIAGQGLRPERVYLQDTDTVGSGKIYYWDTDYIISPAVILLQKMQAATQAQFDLAQKAFLNLGPNFKFLEVSPGTSILDEYNLRPSAITRRTITNKDGTFNRALEEWLTPKANFISTINVNSNLPGLPAPWEDNYEYLKLKGPDIFDEYEPYDYIYPRPTESRSDIEDPNIAVLGGGITNVGKRPLYRWYRDVLELYKYGYDLGVPDGVSEKHKGWEALLNKWFANIPFI